MIDPWYKDGLRFTCTRCGACCTGEPGFVWVNAQEIEEIAAFRGDDPREVQELFVRRDVRGLTLREKANGDCVFYDAAVGCTVYSVRPRQCRTWPFWQTNVESPAAWDRTRQICPGAGNGELIPTEAIIARVKAIRL